jgi:SAM-dependent methyltransferase
MDLLAQQREYYRHRAPEYDQWWQREGRYATGDPEEKARWFADVAEVQRALDAYGPVGDVLELAAGTGWWTQRLTRHARHVTAVDANDETLRINRDRTHGPVSYVQADLFTWTPPPAAFDTVFFAYWLSHVPDDRLDAFWSMVASALRPGGRVFLVDSYHPRRTTGDVQQRRLNDGREFHIVKRFWQPDELAARPGWHLDAHVTEHRGIIWAHGAPER